MKKKILSVILAALMLLTVSVTAFAAEEGTAPAGDALQFDANGKFQILVLADVQDDYPVNEDTLQYIREALDTVKPDLVVFNGDNITIDDKAAYDQLMQPLVERGQKFTFVFGNHDVEDRSFTHEDILEIYQSYEGCLAYDADPSLHGCANHNLPILSSDGTKVAFNLWMFDSGDYIKNEDGSWYYDEYDSRVYDCVRKDQIEWYKETSKKLEAENGGKVPSIAFQHIITEEGVAAILPEMPSFLGFMGRSFENGNAYSFVPVFTRIKSGFIFEPPCPSVDNDGQWDAFVERGDVLGCVFGHDHVNSFIAEYNGIDAIMTPGITSESYSNDMLRGGRIITIDENDPWNYETEMLHFHALALKEGSLLPEITGKSIADFRLQEFLLSISEVALKIGQVLTFFVR
ncbi:MAG: metallophosphoesterase [Clostridia bacterium]|nr:metallophosphoesterase [Clostridia bacterium]